MYLEVADVKIFSQYVEVLTKGRSEVVDVNFRPFEEECGLTFNP